MEIRNYAVFKRTHLIFHQQCKGNGMDGVVTVFAVSNVEEGFQRRRDLATVPSPRFGERPCEGPATHKRRCNIQRCKGRD